MTCAVHEPVLPLRGLGHARWSRRAVTPDVTLDIASSRPRPSDVKIGGAFGLQARGEGEERRTAHGQRHRTAASRQCPWWPVLRCRHWILVSDSPKRPTVIRVDPVFRGSAANKPVAAPCVGSRRSTLEPRARLSPGRSEYISPMRISAVAVAAPALRYL